MGSAVTPILKTVREIPMHSRKAVTGFRQCNRIRPLVGFTDLEGMIRFRSPQPRRELHGISPAAWSDISASKDVAVEQALEHSLAEQPEKCEVGVLRGTCQPCMRSDPASAAETPAQRPTLEKKTPSRTQKLWVPEA